MRAWVVAFCLLSLGSPAKGSAYWNQIRHSARLPDGRVTIRAENPTGAGTSNALLYLSSSVEEQTMLAVPDGPSTVEGTVPGPVAQRRYYGFRLLQGTEIDFMPVRLTDGVTPVPAALTRVATDPAGDQLFGLTHLDLVDCRVSFNGTRLVAAVKNAGGGFPVNSGLTFYGYLLGIADPAQPAPTTVFAMLFTFNQPGVIGPGLYKVTGTGLDDLEKIGEITTTVFASENSLLLSCNLADLYADPYFLSWYDPADPRISVAGFTQKITLLGGAQEADRTPGGDCYLRELAIDPGANQLPALQGLQVVGLGAGAFVQVSYQDADAHCPVLSEVRFDGGPPYAMRPQSLDYGTAVLYRSNAGIPPLIGGSWSQATARYSDNQSDIVEVQLSVAAGPEEQNPNWAALPLVWCTPNPFSQVAVFQRRESADWPLRVQILDAQGRTIRVLAPVDPASAGQTLRWDGRDAHGREVPAGSYFWRAEDPGRSSAAKLVRIR
jgi:hypothetical protein